MSLFNLFKKKDEDTQNQSSYLNNWLSTNKITKPKIQTVNPLQTTQDIKNRLGLNTNINQSKILGSGYTSDYASNPSNYPVKPPTPTPDSTPTSSVPSYISGYEQLAEEKKKLLENQRASKEDYLNKYYSAQSNANQSNIDALNRNLATNKASFNEALATQQALTNSKKQATEDVWGENQRALAQTRGESEARNRNKFAALGTTSSYGAGSYGQAQENVESDFNRSTQQGIRQKEAGLLELDTMLKQYELDAQSKLDNLEIEVTQQLNNIANNQNLTEIEKENAIKDLGYSYQDAVLAVNEGMQDVYKDYYQTLKNAEATSLSDTFMKTGQPQTEADYKYYIENYKAFQPSNGKKTEKQMAYEAAANIAQNALSKLNSGSASSGFGQKALGSIGEKLGTNSSEQQAYRSDIAAMRTAIQNALLGANMSPKEMEQIMAAIPQYNDAPGIAKQKLNSLITNLPILAGSGQTVSALDQSQIEQILASL